MEKRWTVLATVPLFGCVTFKEQAYHTTYAGYLDNLKHTPKILSKDRGTNESVSDHLSNHGHSAVIQLTFRAWVTEASAKLGVALMRYRFNPDNYTFSDPFEQEYPI